MAETTNTITVDPNGTIVAEGPDATRLYALIHARRMLGLEIRTGLKMSRGISILANLQDAGITTKRTKKGALRDLEAHLRDAYGWDVEPLKVD